MRAVWLALVAVLAVTGCTTAVAGDPVRGGEFTGTGAPAPGGAVLLAVPIEIRPVVEAGGATDPATTELPDPDGRPLALAEPVLTLRELAGAEIELDQSARWTLVLDMTEEDGAAFGDLTTDRVGQRLAMVIDGDVVVAPTIASPITEGSVQISGDYTRDEIDDLLARLTGR